MCYWVFLGVELVMGVGVGLLTWQTDEDGNKPLEALAGTLAGVVGVMLILTVLLMVKEACLRRERNIERIYSREESHRLGLLGGREIRRKRGSLAGLLGRNREAGKDSSGGELPELRFSDIIAT